MGAWLPPQPRAQYPSTKAPGSHTPGRGERTWLTQAQHPEASKVQAPLNRMLQEATQAAPSGCPQEAARFSLHPGVQPRRVVIVKGRLPGPALGAAPRCG